MQKRATSDFAGVTSPNTTQVPDQYLDELLPVLSGAELKVLLYITRRTFGFKKPSDNISLSQMLHGIRTRDGRTLDRGVGLTKKPLLRAIKSLAAQRIILTERRRSAERGDEPTCYRLNIITTPPVIAADPVVKIVHQGGGGETPPRGRVSNSPTQQTAEQETGIQQTVSSRSSSSNGIESKPARDHPVPLPEYPAVLITEVSEEFGDAGSIRSNLTRAARLLADSQLSPSTFAQRLFEARSITRDEIHRRRLSGSTTPVAKRMAYFFRVLEDVAGVHPSPRGTVADPGEVQG